MSFWNGSIAVRLAACSPKRCQEEVCDDSPFPDGFACRSVCPDRTCVFQRHGVHGKTRSGRSNASGERRRARTEQRQTRVARRLVRRAWSSRIAMHAMQSGTHSRIQGDGGLVRRTRFARVTVFDVQSATENRSTSQGQLKCARLLLPHWRASWGLSGADKHRRNAPTFLTDRRNRL